MYDHHRHDNKMAQENSLRDSMPNEQGTESNLRKRKNNILLQENHQPDIINREL